MQASFERQLIKLSKAGYPRSVLMCVAETLQQTIKAATPANGARAGKLSGPRPEVVPYVYKMSHSYKKRGQ